MGAQRQRTIDSIQEMITHDGLLNLQAKNISNGSSRRSQNPREIYIDYLFNRSLTDLKGFHRVLNLNISSNKLQWLNKQFFAVMPMLQVLDARSNRIKTLDPFISNLKSLSTLILDNNLMVELPPTISELQNLTELSISGNKLRALPSKFNKLVNLEYLDVSKNILEELPKDFGDL